MSKAPPFALAVVLFAGPAHFMPHTALAQDAAETAVIVSGSAQTGAAQKSLGRSVGSGIGNAANAVGSTNAARTTRRAAPSTYRAAPRGSGGSVPAGVDPLANSDAATYALDNGATIKVSGGFRPATGAHCQRNCPTPAQAAPAQAEPVKPAPVTPVTPEATGPDPQH